MTGSPLDVPVALAMIGLSLAFCVFVALVWVQDKLTAHRARTLHREHSIARYADTPVYQQLRREAHR